MNRTKGLVSVGVPVMNGGATIRLAVESVLQQTYADLEIIISDNCSSDATESICRELAASDSRISYFRQPRRQTVMENFQYVFEQSSGEFFMWAACDDLRSPNYVEVLVRGARDWPDASLVFTDIVTFSEYQNYSNGKLVEYRCDTRGLDQRGRHRAQAKGQCFHFYGLVNPGFLKRYSWTDLAAGADVRLLHWLLCVGDFVYVPGARLYYYKPIVQGAADEEALRTTYRRAGPFLNIWFSWTCAVLVAGESRRKGVRVRQLGLAWFYYQMVRVRPKRWLYLVSPDWVRQGWTAVKDRIASMGQPFQGRKLP